MGKNLKGAALLTHKLKEHGGGSMKKGLERVSKESREAGRQEMLDYFQKLSLLERVFGPSKLKK